MKDLSSSVAQMTSYGSKDQVGQKLTVLKQIYFIGAMIPLHYFVASTQE
jgi:hypothetical protein